MNALVNGLGGLRGLGACVPWGNLPGIWMDTSTNTLTRDCGGVEVGVTTGPHYDVPGTNALLPDSTPQAPTDWPPKHIAVLQSLGYGCLPADWAQPVDGTLPYCKAGQTPQSTAGQAQAVQQSQSQAQSQAQSQSQGTVQASNNGTSGGASAGGAGMTGYTGPRTAAITNMSGGSSSQFLVGDQWTLRVQGPPNTPVTIAATQSGRSLGTTPFGTTGNDGVLVLTGAMGADQIGDWVETYYVGGTPSGSLSFSVRAVPKSPSGSGGNTNTSGGGGSGTSDGGGTDDTTPDDSGAGLSSTEILIGLGAVAALVFFSGSSKKGGR